MTARRRRDRQCGAPRRERGGQKGACRAGPGPRCTKGGRIGIGCHDRRRLWPAATRAM